MKAFDVDKKIDKTNSAMVRNVCSLDRLQQASNQQWHLSIQGSQKPLPSLEVDNGERSPACVTNRQQDSGKLTFSGVPVSSQPGARPETRQM